MCIRDSYTEGSAQTCAGNGAIVNTWEVSDCAGSVTTHSQTITISDTEAPVLSATPADMTVDCASDLPTDPGITATDNCGEILTVTYTEGAIPACVGGGPVINTWEVTDCAGNTTTHSQTITINDTEAPILSDLPADVTVDLSLIHI